MKFFRAAVLPSALVLLFAPAVIGQPVAIETVLARASRSTARRSAIASSLRPIPPLRREDRSERR